MLNRCQSTLERTVKKFKKVREDQVEMFYLCSDSKKFYVHFAMTYLCGSLFLSLVVESFKSRNRLNVKVDVRVAHAVVLLFFIAITNLLDFALKLYKNANLKNASKFK